MDSGMEAIYTENSSEIDDLREEYKNELILLHASLKALNRDLDFSDILKPLLAETGPAMAHVPRLSKQIDHMKKYINEEKAKAQRPAQTSGGSACSAPAQTSRGSGCSAVPAPAQTSAHFPLSKALFQRKSHQLGALKRYATKDCAT